MKRTKISILFVLCFQIASVYAQESPKTLFDFLGSEKTEEQHLGWFVNPEIRSFINPSSFSDDQSVLIGGKFGLLLNHSFYIGLSGYAKTSKLRYVEGNNTTGLGMGYGGLFIGKTFWANHLLHPRLGLTGGYGGASEYKVVNDIRGANHSVGYLFLEPELGLEVNISTMTRLTMGVTYRFVDASNFDVIPKNELNGLSFNVGVLFGNL